MHKKNQLDMISLKRIYLKILKGVRECHKKRIMHRDLKPSNILIDADGKNVKIADFGLSKQFDIHLKDSTNRIQTLWYRAPEILLGSEIYGPAIDVWSLGLILFELLNCMPFFTAESEIGLLF